MKGVTLKLTDNQYEAFGEILMSVGIRICNSRTGLERLAFITIEPLINKIYGKVIWKTGNKNNVRLDVKHCLVLHTYLNRVLIDDELQNVLRAEIFTTIDKKLL